MAAHPGPLSEAGAESRLQEVNWQLRSQLEKTSQDFLDLKEKFLVSEATAYSLANQLRKYKCEKSSDLIKSVLGEKVLCEKVKRADTLPEKLRLCHLLIQDQAKELTRLYKKLREGEEVSQLLFQHLEALLIHDGADHSQGPGLRGQLAEGRRLAKCLARKLSPENYDHDGDDDDNDDEEEEEGEEETTLTIVQYNQMDQEGLKGQDSVAPRLTTQLLEQDTSRDTPDERYQTYSVLPDMSDSYWPYRSSAIFSPENPQVCSSLQVAKYQLNHEEEEGQDPLCPRPSRRLPEVEEQDTQGDSLDECYLTYSALPDLADLQGTSMRAGINSFDDMDNSSTLAVPTESSMVQLTKLQIDPQDDPLGLLSQPPLMLTGVTAV
ncbi:neuroblastoma breakpoint family member 6-like isoform X2 [Mustela erminea]|uniref:neuroblastoma breakpoint family member 6-like isoform X2 n=1 Tax=Mustela erminea TaxID=36723 RepID=UPI0013872D24|nr:neuroblastoma breakpoint family member 6-like isoform X2 [Mustela erminea]